MPSEERGYPPDHPGMMVALFSTATAGASSRQLGCACDERVDVGAVTGLNRPDFRSIADLRKLHLSALSDLLVEANDAIVKPLLVGNPGQSITTAACLPWRLASGSTIGIVCPHRELRMT